MILILYIILVGVFALGFYLGAITKKNNNNGRNLKNIDEHSLCCNA